MHLLNHARPELFRVFEHSVLPDCTWRAAIWWVGCNARDLYHIAGLCKKAVANIIHTVPVLCLQWNIEHKA